jgi:hypothetical protein
MIPSVEKFKILLINQDQEKLPQRKLYNFIFII